MCMPEKAEGGIAYNLAGMHSGVHSVLGNGEANSLSW